MKKSSTFFRKTDAKVIKNTLKPSFSFKKIYKSLNQRTKSIKNRFMVGDKSVLLYSIIRLTVIFIMFHLAWYFSANSQNKID